MDTWQQRQVAVLDYFCTPHIGSGTHQQLSHAREVAGAALLLLLLSACALAGSELFTAPLPILFSTALVVLGLGSVVILLRLRWFGQVTNNAHWLTTLIGLLTLVVVGATEQAMAAMLWLVVVIIAYRLNAWETCLKWALFGLLIQSLRWYLLSQSLDPLPAAWGETLCFWYFAYFLSLALLYSAYLADCDQLGHRHRHALPCGQPPHRLMYPRPQHFLRRLQDTMDGSDAGLGLTVVACLKVTLDVPGPEFFQVIHARLKGQCRPTDTFAYMGDSQFGIILGQVDDKRHIPAILAHLRDKLHSTITYNEQTTRPEITIGISHYPGSHDDAEALWKAASRAQGRAATDGKRWLLAL